VIPLLTKWLNIERLLDEVPTHDLPGFLPLLLSKDSLDGSQCASTYHVSSQHHAGPLLDDTCCVLMDRSPSKYDVGPLFASTITLSSTPAIYGQTLMVDVDPIDD